MFCLTLVLPMVALAANEETHAPLVVSQDHSWPPLAFRDRHGEPHGLLVDLWRALGEEMGRPVQFELVNWPQSIEQVRDGRAAVHGGLFRSPERAQFLDFSQPLLPLETVLFVSTDARARSVRDPALAPIGVVTGSYEREFLQNRYPDLPLREYPNNADLVSAAVAGEVAAFAADYPVGRYLLDVHASPGEFHVLEVLYKQQLVAAVRAGNSAMLKTINRAITELDSEKLARITNRWTHTETVEVTPRWVVPTLFTIAVLLLLLFVGLYLRALRRERSLLSTRLQERTRDLKEQSEQFQALFDNAAMSVMVHDRDTGEVIQANNRALKQYGVESVSALHQATFGASDFWAESPYSLADMQNWFARVREQGPQHFEWLTYHSGGDAHWDEVFLQPVQIGGIPRIISSTIDITARKRAEAELQRQMELEELLRQVSVILLDRERDGVARAMAKLGKFMQASRCSLFNYESEHCRFDLQRQWCAPGVKPREPDFHIPAAAISPYLPVLVRGEALTLNVDLEGGVLLEQFLFSTGSIASLLALPILREGCLTGVLSFSFAEPKQRWSQVEIKLLHVAADLIGNALLRQELEQELQHQASFDSLTGLYNRRKFENLLLHELERADRYHRYVAAILLDIDHFKTVNDRFGHNAGDEVLRQLADTLQTRMRASDVPARWGGEEFIVLLPETDLDGARQTAETLRQTIADTRFPTVGQVTASLGVSTYQPGETLDSLIKRADDALYQAKKAGRNRVRPGPSGSVEC
ncbi:diguanylate cyclase [Thiohalophilus thiocyanatoxydans]|uniref:diguanylate cyclase n=1 Tax=Thiohalophilus thiocyanatoxydans TaxID=381308 RepID=UPI00141704A1|nr:diguanylate cyclase [Thiohalophilus thiocyanatoxydans]